MVFTLWEWFVLLKCQIWLINWKDAFFGSILDDLCAFRIKHYFSLVPANFVYIMNSISNETYWLLTALASLLKSCAELVPWYCLFDVPAFLHHNNSRHESGCKLPLSLLTFTNGLQKMSQSLQILLNCKYLLVWKWCKFDTLCLCFNWSQCTVSAKVLSLSYIISCHFMCFGSPSFQQKNHKWKKINLATRIHTEEANCPQLSLFLRFQKNTKVLVGPDQLPSLSLLGSFASIFSCLLLRFF